MAYYIFVQNDKTNGCGQAICVSEGLRCIEVSEEVFNTFLNDNLTYIWDVENKEIIPNPHYEEDVAARRRQELDMLTLTPADVERALYKAKGMDFEDLKALIVQALPTVDIKGLAIEFRAKDFFRGATANGMRLFDVVGQLLGYTSDDMDYLFINKELPINEGVNNNAN